MSSAAADTGIAAGKDPSELNKRVLRGSLWTVLGFGSSQALRLCSNLLLAHLLFPEAFGLMALVLVFIQGLEMCSDLSVWRCIVQHKRGDDPLFLNTAWTLSALRGAALWLAGCALAWPFAWLYEQPILAPLLAVSALTALLHGLNSTALYTLNRQIKIGPLTAVELAAQLIAVAVTVACAVYTGSVWSLVIGALTSSASKTLASHLFLGGVRNRFAWDSGAARELLRFGSWLMLSSTVTFLALSGDRLVLGKLMSAAELGLYSIALIFAMLITTVASRLADTVLFPLLSRHQDQPERMMEVLLSIRWWLLTLAVCLCALLAVGAPMFFDLLYDHRYAPAGRIAQWLMVFTWGAVMLVGIDLVQVARGYTRDIFFANLIRSFGLVLAAAGYQFSGLPGFVIGLTAATLVAQAYLIARLPGSRLLVLRQSLLFSAGLAAFVLTALAGIEIATRHFAQAGGYAAALLFSAAPCALALFAVRRGLKLRGNV